MLHKIILALLIGFILNSCNTIYFEHAPISKEGSMKEIPKKYQGIWGDEKDGFIVISSNQIIYQDSKKVQIPYSQFDSNKHIIKNGQFYLVKPSKFLDISKGFDYTLKEDTFYVDRFVRLDFDLGSNLRVQELENGLLINIMDRISTWWVNYYVTINENKDVYIHDLNFDKFKSTYKQNLVYKKSNNYYYNVKLGISEMNQLQSDNYFQDTVIQLLDSFRLEKLPATFH